jgi:hypothetical protein
VPRRYLGMAELTVEGERDHLPLSVREVLQEPPEVGRASVKVCSAIPGPAPPSHIVREGTIRRGVLEC